MTPSQQRRVLVKRSRRHCSGSCRRLPGSPKGSARSRAGRPNSAADRRSTVARADLSEDGDGHFRTDQMGRARRHARHLLFAAVGALGPRARRTEPGGAGRSRQQRFYFFFIEIWPQEVYYFTGLLIMAAVALFLVNALFGRLVVRLACPQTVWTDLYIADRALDRGRSQRPHPRLRRRALDARASSAQARRQAYRLADDRGGDRRRLGFLFRRRADAGHNCDGQAPFAAYAASPSSPSRPMRWAADARAGLHLYVPLAAHPGGA